MQRPAGHAIAVHVEAVVEIQHTGDRGRDRCADSADRIQPRRRGDRLVGDVQRQHHDRPAALEHRMGGVRVDIDIELGRRRGVAGDHRGPAHQHDFADFGQDARRLDDGLGDVGQRPQRAKRDAVRPGGQACLDDKIHRMPLGRRHGWRRQVAAVQPGLAMHIFRRYQRPQHRSGTAGIHRNVGAPRQFHQPARIGGGQLQRYVAGDAGDAADIELVRRGHGHQQGDGIVLAGVGVDDDGAGGHGGSNGGGRAVVKQHAGGQRGIDSQNEPMQRRFPRVSAGILWKTSPVLPGGAPALTPGGIRRPRGRVRGRTSRSSCDRRR